MSEHCLHGDCDDETPCRCHCATCTAHTVHSLLAAARMLREELAEERSRREALAMQKDNAYHERDQCVALIARMAVALGYRAGLGRHIGGEWDNDWRTIVFVDLPAGQVSWHIHDSEVPLFDFIGQYAGSWDGHTTPEKYERCRQPVENARATRAESALAAARALLREVVEHLPTNERTRPTAADLRARIEAHLEDFFEDMDQAISKANEEMMAHAASSAGADDDAWKYMDSLVEQAMRAKREHDEIRTRLAAAEAERDRYRSALRDVAREWPYLDLIDPQTAQECDLRGLVEYLLGALRGEQRTAREALGGQSNA